MITRHFTYPRLWTTQSDELVSSRAECLLPHSELALCHSVKANRGVRLNITLDGSSTYLHMNKRVNE